MLPRLHRGNTLERHREKTGASPPDPSNQRGRVWWRDGQKNAECIPTPLFGYVGRWPMGGVMMPLMQRDVTDAVGWRCEGVIDYKEGLGEGRACL